VEAGFVPAVGTAVNSTVRPEICDEGVTLAVMLGPVGVEDPQGVNVEDKLCGFGVPLLKSLPLTSVSVHGFIRMTACAVVGLGDVSFPPSAQLVGDGPNPT
jgi:hypothetical protein